MLLPPMNSVRTFECAARHLSFSQAADELHVTPSAVSHQIKGLEEYLGIKLFRRKTRQIELTSEAQVYLQAVQRALRELSEATKKIKEGEQGAIVLSVAPAFASGWLIPRLYDYYNLYPETEVQFVTSLKLVDFDNSNVDMGVRFGPGDWPGLTCHHLFEEELVPVCSPERFEKDCPESPQDLSRFPLLLIERKMDDWPVWFSGLGVDFTPSTRSQKFQNTPLMIEAAAAGLGYGMTNRTLIQHELESGRLIIPFDVEAQVDSGYYLVYPTQKHLSAKLEQFRDWMLGQIKNA